MLCCILCFNPITEPRGIDTELKHDGCLTIMDIIKLHFGFTDENLSSNPKEKFICKNCWMKLEIFHEMYRMVKTNYNMFTEENVATEVIEIKTEEEKIKETKNYKFKNRRAEQDRQVQEFANMKCELCPDEQFETFELAMEHHKNMHNTKGYVVCCRRKYQSRRKLMDHINKHLDPDLFKCSLCDKRFASKQYLSQHRMLHFDKKNSQKYQCDYCSKSFVHKFQIRAHIFNIHFLHTLEATHQCTDCPKKFKTENTLKRHHKNVHAQHSSEFICELCTKELKSKDALKNHIKSVHQSSNAQERMHCTICDHYLLNLKSYKCHMKRHTESQVKHTCPHCSKQLPNKTSLRGHVKYIHQTNNIFTCKYCEKGFKRKTDHTDHEATHTIEYVYSCEFCAKKFRSNSNMHKHRKVIHPEEYEKIKPDYLKEHI